MTLPPFDLLPLFRQQERSAEAQVKAPQQTEGVQGIEEAIESSFLTADEAYAIEASGLYSACSVENLRLSRRVSSLIVNERGELQIHLLQSILNCLKHKKRFLLTLFCEERNVRISHIIAQMEFLAQSIEAQKIIKRISRPYANKLAERAIVDTLELPFDHVPTDADTRRAVLTALFTMLRQSLGSCFATAPAIMLHEEQTIAFLTDLEELIGTGQLKKTVLGIEYHVPMSRTWGNGELKKSLSLAFPLDRSENKIWLSPLLHSALSGIHDKNIDSPYLFSLFEKLTEENGVHNAISFSTTADRLITLVFQDLFSISDDDFKREEGSKSGPNPLNHASGLIVHSPETISFEKKSSPTSVSLKLKARAEKEKRIKEILLVREKVRRSLKMAGECALLKQWEFTLASFAEVKFDLCRWNFYSSLGINWDDEGGIGQVLYSIGKECVDEANRDLEREKERFDAINIEVSYLEQRVKQASSEQEVSWIKMEYQSRKTEQYHIQQLCDQIAEKARKIAAIHQFLIDQYDRLLKVYFQEIYDADLHDVEVGPFDDSPAGFRLIYKHGRSNPSLWTPITTLDEFITALASFFTLTEQELSSQPEIKGIEREFSTIITRLITHIRSQYFQETALNRTLVAHGLRPIKNPLDHLDKLEKKPWVFTSGGSMSSLVSSYFKLEREIDESSRWVENETELLAFLIDTVRLSYNRIQFDRRSQSDGRVKGGSDIAYSNSVASPQKARFRSLLMHSPTHAFRLLPESPLFNQAWTSDMYSYSWIANSLRDPWINFIKESLLSPQAIAKLAEDMSALFPAILQKKARDSLEQALVPFMRTFDIFKACENIFTKDIYMRDAFSSLYHSGKMSEFFYTHFPYSSLSSCIDAYREYMDRLSAMGRKLPHREKGEIAIKKSIKEPVSASVVKDILTSAVAQSQDARMYSTDELHSLVAFLRSKKMLFPEPVIVADTNWMKDYFGFIVSPLSLEIELWALSYMGTYGRPIPHWKRWLNGSDKSRTWGLFISPSQYQMFY